MNHNGTAHRSDPLRPIQRPHGREAAPTPPPQAPEAVILLHPAPEAAAVLQHPQEAAAVEAEDAVN